MSKTIEISKLYRVSINLKRACNFEFCIEALCTLFFLPLNISLLISQSNYEHFKDLKLADSGSNNDIELLIGSDFCRSMVTGNVKIGKKWGPCWCRN